MVALYNFSFGRDENLRLLKMRRRIPPCSIRVVIASIRKEWARVRRVPNFIATMASFWLRNHVIRRWGVQ